MKVKCRSLKILARYSCLCFLLHAPLVFAGNYQSHKSIYQAARIFIRNHVVSMHNQQSEIKIDKLDPRLKLKKCDKQLQAFLPKGSRDRGRTTVGVKCAGKKSWSLHVPLTISLYGKVLVSSHLLQKGSILTGSDIKLSRYNLANLSFGYYENLESGIGMKLKRRVSAGAVLTPAMLGKPQIIARGQKITIMAQSGNMLVRMKGKALNNGAVGDRIKVMNIQSKKKLEGIITLNGEVKVEI